jgi:putative ABC transport system ATP-binding protein
MNSPSPATFSELDTGVPATAEHRTDNAALLSARDLHKSFGQTHALRGVSLDVAGGEIVAIMGPSVSGKSTLLHCLAGVITPDSGTVTFKGKQIQTMDEQQRAALRLAGFGFVFQFGQLLPELSAVDNVSVPLLLAGVRRSRALARANRWLDRLELTGLGDKLPGEMSGGEAQRVAVARAMASEPDVLFADEPTGSLDSLAAENVMTLMVDLVRETGITVLVITHDARTAAYADRTVIVRDGNASGRPTTCRPTGAVA